ncbi:iron complex outermembrane receptor protein [Sphingomonas kyeonggiensis]|uniref:Iron complex outermembrane receptor protein n=1 Tax=Sphingomonas kyeonggiensis TaxID=1268553 RepID=A0A7W7K3S8_9SPHN|nr:TonB-dependent receptor [Sphingomonas kyeonggiensis]MBB4840088.1 iron complex outermembrane receptor protein [Sphingomonas kyeonggiensis]
MQNFSRFRLSLLAGSTLLALAATPALAQQQAADPATQTAAPDDDQTGLTDIVVTAQRRETNLQETPISISVLSTEALQDRHVQSLFNLADGTVPSLRVATFEARQSALTIGIRGIVPYDQNQTARDAGVGVYIDGVALGKTQGLNAALFDIERIEVLKGPQGTLFGRNTEGGALSLVTRAPTGEFGARMTAGLGNYGSRNAEAHIDLPAFANIALKFDGVYQHQDPTVKDPLEGSTGWNYYDRKGGRAAARWTPFDGLTADFSYDYAKDENTPQYSQLINYNPNNYAVGSYTPAGGTIGTTLYLPGTTTACGGTIAAGSTKPVCVAPRAPLVGVHPDRQTVADVGVPQQPSVDITHGFTSNLKYKVSPNIELRSITAWRGVSTDQWDNSGGPERSTYAPNANFSRYSLSFLDQHQFSQEFQAVGSFDQFDFVLGAYYYTEHATEYAATPLSNLWNADGTAYTIRSPIVSGTVTSANSGYQPYNASCVNTLAATVPQFTNSCQFITRASKAWDHNYSAFGNLTFSPEGTGLHFTAGGRFTKDKRHGNLYVVNNVVQGFSFENSVNRFDPMFNIAYDATPDMHLYAKYSTGFRAGGANDRSQSFNAFGPESVKSYEIGAKMDFLDHRARLNLAGYIMNRSNTQFDFDLFDTSATSPTNGSHIEQTQNAGDTKIRGIEADLTLKPTRELTLTGSYAYTYWKAPSAVNPLTGGLPQQLYIVYTPTNAASGAIDYALPVNVAGGANLRIHLDANYASSQYSFQLEPTKTDPSFVVNGRIALADIQMKNGSTVTLSVWSRNLLDHTYIYRRSNANSSPVLNYGANGALVSTNYGGILGDYANFNPPRTFGGEVSVKF